MSGVLTAGVGAVLGAVSLPAELSANDVPLTLENDGDIDIGGDSGDWVTPKDAAIAALYEARASSLSGDTAEAVGTFDAWLPLSTSRSWSVNPGGFLCTFTLEIRDAATKVVRDSAACTVSSS